MKDVKDLVDAYNSVMEDAHNKIRELIGDTSEMIPFDQDGFEDDSSNDIGGISVEGVHGASDDLDSKPIYEIEELSFWDSVKIIEILEKRKVN